MFQGIKEPAVAVHCHCKFACYSCQRALWCWFKNVRGVSSLSWFNGCSHFVRPKFFRRVSLSWPCPAAQNSSGESLASKRPSKSSSSPTKFLSCWWPCPQCKAGWKSLRTSTSTLTVVIGMAYTMQIALCCGYYVPQSWAIATSPTSWGCMVLLLCLRWFFYFPPPVSEFRLTWGLFLLFLVKQIQG